jgi:hypothetical protein
MANPKTKTFRLLSKAIAWVNTCLLMRTKILCPCCGLMVYAARRRIDKKMGIALSLLGGHRDRNGNEYVHVGRLMARKKYVDKNRDWSRLKHWGFIEERVSATGEGRGFWRITDDGLDFLDGKIQAPKVRYIFNDRVVPITALVEAEAAIMVDINQVMASEGFNVNDWRAL